MTGQSWGGQPLSIAYDFGTRTATVTDRRSHSWVHQHDADGHATQTTDPVGAVWQTAYDAEGLVTLETITTRYETEEEIEGQLDKANEIFADQADVLVYWTRIKEDPDPKEVLTAEGAQALLRWAGYQYSIGKYEGIPIHYIREVRSDTGEGGSSNPLDDPGDRRRSAIVSRYWPGGTERTNQYTTAHELGHAIGGLCDPMALTRNCRSGAPNPPFGGVMQYPSKAYPKLQGDQLSDGEVKRLREYAQVVAGKPDRRPR